MLLLTASHPLCILHNALLIHTRNPAGLLNCLYSCTNTMVLQVLPNNFPFLISVCPMCGSVPVSNSYWFSWWMYLSSLWNCKARSTCTCGTGHLRQIQQNDLTLVEVSVWFDLPANDEVGSYYYNSEALGALHYFQMLDTYVLWKAPQTRAGCSFHSDGVPPCITWASLFYWIKVSKFMKDLSNRLASKITHLMHTGHFPLQIRPGSSVSDFYT